MRNILNYLSGIMFHYIVKIDIFIILCFVFLTTPIFAQKTVNQKGRVREITYNYNEPIEPIKNVRIKLRGGVEKRSLPGGVFYLPISEYSSFYIESIDPPTQNKYTLILPSKLELKNPFKFSSNLFEIILSNNTKQQQEEIRIIQNHENKYNALKSGLELQIRNLKTKLKYSQSKAKDTIQLLNKQLDSLQILYNRIPKEFNSATIQAEIERLVAIDYALLTPEEAARIDSRKEGDWLTLQELARKNLPANGELEHEINNRDRNKGKLAEIYDSIAKSEAIIRKGLQAYRDMFDSYANMHNNDSAAYYIDKLLTYPAEIIVDDYINCANFIYKQIKDTKKAEEIISKGIAIYRDSNELDSEIRLILTLAEFEYDSGHIHEASSLFAHAEDKLDLLDHSHAQTLWYAKNKIGSFCVSIGEIKKGINLLESCKSTFENYDIQDSYSYEFLLNYASSLISIGNYTEADAITEDLLTRLTPLRGNLFYNELYADCLCSKANIQMAKGMISESVDNLKLAISIYTELFGESSKAVISPRIALADYLFSVGKFDEAKDALDNIEEIIETSYEDVEVPTIQINLMRAEFYYNLANFNEAENLYLEQIQKINKHFDKQPINAIDAYLGLSKIYAEKGDFQRALDFLLDCDSLIHITFPKDGLYRIRTLSGIANIKFETEKFLEATDLLKKSMTIARDMVGDKSQIYESLSVAMASYKRQLGFYDQANSIINSVGKNREILGHIQTSVF